jgi:lipopolysaccharide biosynthesis regulator YciM
VTGSFAGSSERRTREVDALEEIERVLNIDPKNARALAFRGDIAREQGAYDAAIDV